MRRQLTADELEALFHNVGECIWHIQYLEDALQTFLTMKVDIKEPGRVEAKEAMALLDKQRRATLGTAIKTAEKTKALPEDLINQLRELKEERDWLVHRSMHQAGDSLYTDHGRNAVLTRLELLQKETHRLKYLIMCEIETLLSSHGVSIYKARALAEIQIAALKGVR